METRLRYAIEQTFAVLKATFLQSGKMLTDHAGKRYDFPLKVTVASDCVPKFARNAAHDPDAVLYTEACEDKLTHVRIIIFLCTQITRQ